MELREILLLVARGLVKEDEAVTVTEAEGAEGPKLSLKVAPSDVGRVIGKHGKTADALRTLLAAAAARQGKSCTIEIVE